MTAADATLELLYGLVLEDGRRWGDAAERWQRDDARAVLDADGPRLHYLTRPRGGSKTSDLGAVVTCALLVQAPRVSRSYGYAADRGQAGLLLDAVRGYVERTPGLAGSLHVEAHRATVRSSGATLEVESSDDASSWGRRPWLTVVDELAQWKDTPGPRRLWSSIVSALPKVPGSRLAVLTSPGDPASWAFRVLEEARGSARWRTSEVAGPVPWLDVEDLAEQRRLLLEWQYARLHEGRWVGADDRLVDVEGLRECVVLDGPVEPVAGRRYVVGVDVGLKDDRTVVAVCHAEPVDVPDGDGLRRASRVVLDRMLVFAGSRRSPVQLGTVEEALLDVWSRYVGARMVLDPWQAVGLAQRLRGRGVQVEEFAFSSRSVGRLASTLHLLLRDRLLALPEDAELLEELAHVRLRETSPGVVRMDHDAGRHDDRAVALALAALPLVQASSVGGSWSSSVGRGLPAAREGPRPGGLRVAGRR
ncbi:hypothetical protein [Nitriliruptor alkaliphilus]|uniref:hypothetical protein n=1 Tax=Nitriliruptor alkaliphilus TaxID=427918 RepID=UPI000696A634|nr:hypothetical protein [Nitriliruptor alkaliphilus]